MSILNIVFSKQGHSKGTSLENDIFRTPLPSMSQFVNFFGTPSLPVSFVNVAIYGMKKKNFFNVSAFKPITLAIEVEVEKFRNCIFNLCALSLLHLDTHVLTSRVDKVLKS